MKNQILMDENKTFRGYPLATSRRKNFEIYALAPYMHNLENQRKSHQKSGKYFLTSKRDVQIKECE